MRVGLAMITLVPGAMGGSERYARELARTLPATGLDVTAIVGEDVPPFEGIPTVTLRGYRPGASTAARLRVVARATARSGGAHATLAPFDVVHYPFTVPLPAARPRVVTLHDVQHRDLPALFGRAERAYRRIAYDRAATSAEAVIVISEFVRERAVTTLELDAARVHVVPLGVDHDRFRPGTADREPFVLYPARAWPHKNHRRLFAAFEQLRSRLPKMRLVLTGAKIDDLPQGVECRGTVGDDELADLYRRASALVFPSLYEGFGLPPLEAMASGCPVAASAAAAVPEVCGDAAVLFDPYDPAAIAGAVEEALARRDELAEKGLARASEFTWDATARAHARVYAAVA